MFSYSTRFHFPWQSVLSVWLHSSVFTLQSCFCVQRESWHEPLQRHTRMRALKTNLHLTVRKIFIGEGGSAHPSPSHPQNDLRLPRACPHSPHIPQNSCWKWVCVTGPLGAPSRGWRPSRAGPFSHGQLLRSRRVSEGKTWTWNDPTKQSPRWVHPQATAPVPLTPKLFALLFFWTCFSN